MKWLPVARSFLPNPTGHRTLTRKIDARLARRDVVSAAKRGCASSLLAARSGTDIDPRAEYRPRPAQREGHSLSTSDDDIFDISQLYTYPIGYQSRRRGCTANPGCPTQLRDRPVRCVRSATHQTLLAPRIPAPEWLLHERREQADIKHTCKQRDHSEGTNETPTTACCQADNDQRDSGTDPGQSAGNRRHPTNTTHRASSCRTTIPHRVY
jgi:hypothetical protein